MQRKTFAYPKCFSFVRLQEHRHSPLRMRGISVCLSSATASVALVWSYPKTDIYSRDQSNYINFKSYCLETLHENVFFAALHPYCFIVSSIVSLAKRHLLPLVDVEEAEGKLSIHRHFFSFPTLHRHLTKLYRSRAGRHDLFFSCFLVIWNSDPLVISGKLSWA